MEMLCAKSKTDIVSGQNFYQLTGLNLFLFNLDLASFVLRWQIIDIRWAICEMRIDAMNVLIFYHI